MCNYVCYTKLQEKNDLPIWRGRFKTFAAAQIFAELLDLSIEPSDILYERATSLANGIRLYVAGGGARARLGLVQKEPGIRCQDCTN